MHILTLETYQEDFPVFYKSYIRYLTDKNNYLTKNTLHGDINITVETDLSKISTDLPNHT